MKEIYKVKENVPRINLLRTEIICPKQLKLNRGWCKMVTNYKTKMRNN